MIPFMKVLPAITPQVIAKAIQRDRAQWPQEPESPMSMRRRPARSRESRRWTCCTDLRRAGLRGSGLVVAVGENLDAFIQAGVVPGSGDDRLRSQTIRVGVRWINQGYTGYLRQNYIGRDTRGLPTSPQSS